MLVSLALAALLASVLIMLSFELLQSSSFPVGEGAARMGAIAAGIAIVLTYRYWAIGVPAASRATLVMFGIFTLWGAVASFWTGSQTDPGATVLILYVFSVATGAFSFLLILARNFWKSRFVQAVTIISAIAVGVSPFLLALSVAGHTAFALLYVSVILWTLATVVTSVPEDGSHDGEANGAVAQFRDH